MPLSEQEQRLLDEMERNLYQNDADFVATVSGRGGKPNYRSVVIGALIALAGIAILVTGVVVNLPLIGLLGFAVMFAGVLLAVAPPRRLATPVTKPRAKSTAGGRRQGSFMDGLNERWDRRSDERGR
jgi:hypothetical protein